MQNLLSQGFPTVVAVFLLDTQILADSAVSSEKKTRGKEVRYMKFKFIHISIVDAETLDEAREKLAVKRRLGTGDDFFETEIVKRQDEKQSGWIASAINQVIGK